MKWMVSLRSGMVAGLLCAAAFVAPGTRAQETSVVDVSGAYSYLRANTIAGQQIHMQGASGSFAYNINKWVGLAVDVGGYEQTRVADSGRTLNVTTFLAGPRLSWHHDEKWTTFGQVLLGGGHAGGTVYTEGANPLGTQNAFAMTIGGGIDYSVHPRVAIRLLQAEYLRTQFDNGINHNQNNLRLSFGVVFHIGQK